MIRCKYCGKPLYRSSTDSKVLPSVCGAQACRARWLADDPARRHSRQAADSVREDRLQRRAKAQEAEDILTACAGLIARMRATKGVAPEAEAVPHGECCVCGTPLTHNRMHYCSDACHTRSLRVRLARWKRTHPDPVPGHCPVCGVKTKPGHRYCSDPCMREWARMKGMERSLRLLEKAMSIAGELADKEGYQE